MKSPLQISQYQVLVNIAFSLATVLHRGQKRKYSGLPYITHPCAVAEMLHKIDPETYHEKCDIIGAAYLHDVIEDCDVTSSDLEDLGVHEDIIGLVVELTNTSKLTNPELNRKERKAMDNERLSRVSEDAKIIKQCDIYCNTRELICNEGVKLDYIDLYINEKSEQMAAVSTGSSVEELFYSLVMAYKKGREHGINFA